MRSPPSESRAARGFISDGPGHTHPVTDTSAWLVASDHPALTRPEAIRIDDARRPDRLAWNAFRTLAEWNSDVWVPALLEEALGRDNPLSGLDWAGAAVELWRTAAVHADAVDVTIDGPEAIVLVEATFATELELDRFSHGIDRAMGLVRGGPRQAAFALVVPDWDESLEERLADFFTADLGGAEMGDGHGLRGDVLARLTGWLTWHDLVELALDLAEEANEFRVEQVHLLATELQDRFPQADL